MPVSVKSKLRPMTPISFFENIGVKVSQIINGVDSHFQTGGCSVLATTIPKICHCRNGPNLAGNILIDQLTHLFCSISKASLAVEEDWRCSGPIGGINPSVFFHSLLNAGSQQI